MLERIKAKRAALEEEMAVHKALVNSLADRIDVLNDIIREEEAFVEATKENIEVINTEEIDCE